MLQRSDVALSIVKFGTSTRSRGRIRTYMWVLRGQILFIEITHLTPHEAVKRLWNSGILAL